MSLKVPYPGCVGILDSPPQIPLSDEEVAALRTDVSSVMQGVADEEAFLSGLVHAANVGRRTAELDDERLPARRRANLDFVEARVRAQVPGALRSLSGINAFSLRLMSDAPEEMIFARFAQLRKNMPGVQRGRPNKDSRVYMALDVAKAFREHFGEAPTCGPNSKFNFLLACVAKAVDGGDWENMHRLAEQVLRIELIEESPAISYYKLPRFN